MPQLPTDELASAAESGDLPVVRQILASHPGLLSRPIFDQDTALHIAAYAKQAAVVKFLVSAGADVHSEGMHRKTALHCAVSEGDAASAPVVRMLLRAGADPNALDLHERTALDIAVSEQIDDLESSIQLLLHAGADWSPLAAFFRSSPDGFIRSLDHWAPKLSQSAISRLRSLVEQLVRPQDPMAVIDSFAEGGMLSAEQIGMMREMAQSQPAHVDPRLPDLRQKAERLRVWHRKTVDGGTAGEG